MMRDVTGDSDFSELRISIKVSVVPSCSCSLNPRVHLSFEKSEKDPPQSFNQSCFET